jgi:hypothetical protein
MTSLLDEFIVLDRTFHELAIDASADDDADLTRLFGLRDAFRWPNLLSEYRVIILSEAGSGKTEEIRNIARNLRREVKPAFFVRIENVSQNFEDAFEEGSFEGFCAWSKSGKEGWLFLDSVDEARLRDPRDFELAIKKLGRLLAPVLQQAHIVITGRTTAWRAKTDLLLCQTTLPYRPAERVTGDDASVDEMQDVVTKKSDIPTNPAAPFKIVALDDLHGAQIDAFLIGKGVQDCEAFRGAVDRKDAWSLTTRPQDLAELVEFWREHRRIGSRYELMGSSISRRLIERDQDRSEARPIAVERLRLGARLVAATTTLAQVSAIRVPDGSENAKGIAIQEVLLDWNDIDCAALLSRPIFDEGIYGTVRFHHRSVREYLTAEWLHALIVDDGSRAQVESLFFRTQYGIEVIVPTMRPVLPWLAILDARILARIRRLAPEVLFEGGDPSQLQLETRSKILREACEQLAQPAHGRSLTDYAAVQRFANVDLTDDIKFLLARYREDDDISWFLLRMVWQGEIVGAADEAKSFALASRGRYARIAAFRAIATVGSAENQAEVRRSFIAEDDTLNREWLAELILGLPQNDETATWLLEALRRAGAREKFSPDNLASTVLDRLADWPLPLVPKFIIGFNALLQTPPLFERRHCEISERYRWLVGIAAQSVLRLIQADDPFVLDAASLSIVRKLRIAEEYGEHDLRDIKAKLLKHVTERPALTEALFWQDVAETRRGLDVNKGERLIDCWLVQPFGHFSNFNASSFDTICENIVTRTFLDDRLVALTVAFEVYRWGGRPASWRKRLKHVANAEPELSSTLHGLLHPPAKGRLLWKKQETHWKKQAAKRLAVDEARKRDWKDYLDANVETLRNPVKRGVITNAQCYLHDRMRENSDRSGKWSEGNWHSLVSKFGETVAFAFREGVVNFWRGHREQLLSEGAKPNTTPFSAIFGLTGLSIESRESSNWPAGLSPTDVDSAIRFAFYELNGFPDWLPGLYAAYPQSIVDAAINEIDYELATESPESESHYVLYDASWNGNWMWERLGPLILTRLRRPPKNISNLRYMLTIIQGSSLDDKSIAKLAAQKSKSTANLSTLPLWFAVWVGVDPATAIPTLKACLAKIKNNGQKALVAMRFIVALVGDRRYHRSARQGYRTVEHMKALYLLMHDYVREDEDIDRSNGGVYSPELRDDAQRARDALFSFIREMPGKDAFLALVDISRVHPTTTTRPWMAFYAKEKATLDADGPPWSPRQVREFHERLERTPSNHRDLWYLALDRVSGLKHDLEDGDTSIASILQRADRETEIRNYIGNWCREHAGGKYTISQEDELADAKRPDLRFHGVGFDAPVPLELKLADKWTGPHLFERLEIQLVGDYLRDRRSSRGIFGLIYLGIKSSWDLPNGKRAESFNDLIEALQNHWTILAPQFSAVEDISVIGIDLTKRGLNAKNASRKKGIRKPGRAQASTLKALQKVDMSIR